MLRSALAELRAHPGRFFAVCLAIVLGVGFAAGTLVYTASFNSALQRSVAADVSRVDVVVTADQGRVDLAAIARVPGVRHVAPAVRSSSDFVGPGGRGYLQLANIPVDPDQRWYSLASGHWPDSGSELAVDRGTATRHSWQLGRRIILGDGAGARQVVVVAILDTGISPLADASDSGYGTLDLLDAQPGVAQDTAYLTVDRGHTAGQVAASIRAALGASVTVSTAADVATDAVRKLGGGTDVLTVILLAFVVLAGLVAAMVVANTFTILLTQRRRQIALLRCIGASGRQVRQSALVEAALVAVVGSMLGLAVGIGVGRVACSIAGINGIDFRVDPISLGMAGVVGVIVTLLAVLAPTARASRIPPMVALRPVESAERARSVGRARVALGSSLLLGGGAVLAGGVYLATLTIAVVGGALTAIGVILLLRVVLPVILRSVSGLGGLFGAPGRLAVANTLRDPARAAATCGALVVGVGAIVTLLVAASSAQAGADQAVGARHPLDLQVTTSQGALPVDLRTSVSGVDGVRAAVDVAGTEVTVAGDDYQMFGPTEDQLALVRNGGELARGQVALPGYLVEQLGLHSGDPVTVRRGSASISLAVAPRPITDDGSIVVLASDLQRLDPAPAIRGVWAKFTASASPNAVMAKVNALVALSAEVRVSGAGVERAATADVLGSVIKVALALLAVAVAIAVVGIGNTLGLSVVERTRESALLRALGLRRRQLRSMLAVEAILLALVAAVVGSLFGLIFGWAAVGSAFGQAGQPVVLSVPFGQLAAVFAGTLVAGVLASVLPGRRAVRATPTQALVEI